MTRKNAELYAVSGWTFIFAGTTCDIFSTPESISVGTPMHLEYMGLSKMRPWRIPVFVAMVLASMSSAGAQETRGPIEPPPKFEVKRVPVEPHGPPPPIPEEEIIRRFAANEDVMKKVYDTYRFSEAIRVEELSDPGGMFSVTGEVSTKPDGQRNFRVVKQPESTLKQTAFTLEDVRVLASIPLFVLTAKEIPNYNLKYMGKEKLDQLDTYIFRVKPKEVSRQRKFFDGVVWVDDHDFAVVKSYGQFVSEVKGEGTQLPFTTFEIYRENFQEKYWLPSYIRSDDILPQKGGELRLRLVIRSTDFHMQTPGATSSAAAPKASAPASKPN